MSDVITALWRQIAASPEAPALQGPGFCLSYAALGRAVQQLSHAWLRAGLVPGERIGLLATHSPEFVMGLLACWQTGAVAVPLDLSAPERLAEMQQRSRPRWVLDTRLPLASGWASRGACKGAHNPETAASEAFVPAPGHPAYLLFSSGSSGRPKGVLVPHDGLLGVLQAQIQALALRPGQRCLWVLSPAFDASLSDIGTALLSGATLVVEHAPLRDFAHLQGLLREWQIAYVDLPPALLSWLDPQHCPDSLETVLIGGEVPPVEAVRHWARRVRLISVYGPTEATICTSLTRCGPDWEQPVLGKPLPGVRYLVLDAHGRAAENGELWIQAPGLALGYWEDPALTASRFVERHDGRWYRSGDAVQRLPDGQLRFAGRYDRQFKHNGRLVCPEESEAVLLGHPQIARAAVVPHVSGPLVAWLELRSDPNPPLDSQGLPPDLSAYLSARLPQGLQPQRCVPLAALPLTPSGKPDLPRLQNRPLPAPGASENGVLQHALAHIWARLLARPLAEIAQPGADFFALGGSSLQVLACVALAAEAGLLLSPEQIYSGRTLAGVVALSQTGADQTLPAATLRQRLRKDLPPLVQPPFAQGATASGWLLTGATGFLGSRLLAAWLQQDGPPLHCLVRAATPAQGRQRVESALAPWGVPFDPERVQIWCGDLTHPRLGLENAEWHTLQRQLTGVLHSAAQVDLVRDLNSLWAANVASLRSLAELGCPLHHISSLSVLVGAQPLPVQARETDRLANTAWVAGGYAQSKWAAEAWLLAQAGPHWIYRPGLVSGDSQSGWAPTRDWLRWLISGLLQTGALPEEVPPELALDLSPVDHVARAILQLSQGPAGIRHLANPQPLTLRHLVEILAARYSLPRLPLQPWQARARQQLQRQPDLAASAALLALSRALAPHTERHWHSLNLFQATGITLASRETDAALARAGLMCPDPETLLQRYLNHWESEGLRHVA